MKLIGSKELHDAADAIGVDAEEEKHGIKEGAIFEFVDGSDFPNFPQLEPVSFAYGILVGRQASINQEGKDE